MGLFVNTNVASINAQRNLSDSQSRLSTRFARLSSGLRINTAADDAAGLSISERFTSQIRGLGQAVRNANDGLSLSQVAEGALAESTNILQRMRELAIQAANDINESTDRQALQDEIDQLVEELTRIGDTTTFNGNKLLDGSFVDAYFQVGSYARETVRISIRDARSLAIGRYATETGSVVTTNALAAGDMTINGINIRATQDIDDPRSSSDQSGSAIAKAAAINDTTEFHGVTAKVLPTVLVAPNPVSEGDFDAVNSLIINGETIAPEHVFGDDANHALVLAINDRSRETGVTASLDEQSRLVLRAEDGRNIAVESTANFTGFNEDVVGTAALNLHSEAEYQLGGAQEAFIGFANNALIGVTQVEAILTTNVLTRQEANDSLLKIDRALAQINADRAQLGAVTNRLQSTMSNLSTTIEGSSAARSRIRDADFAAETSALTKDQILQQAGTSILAQANQASQQVLSLLQG